MAHKIPCGQSTLEYGLIIAAIAVIVLLGLTNLGNSLSNLFSQNSEALIANSTGGSANQNAPLHGEKPAATSIREYAKAGAGYYMVIKDPNSGKPTLMHMTEVSQPVNTTSIDGNQFNALGTTRIANQFRQLAEAETDPELKDYYTQLAMNAYYMGAIEGSIDGVSNFSFDQQYSRGSALRDFEFQKSSMESLINNPPPGLDPKTYASVMPLAVEVHNIGKHYDLTHNYYTDGNGNMQYLNPLATNPKGFTSIAQLTTLDQLKSISTQVLSDNKVESVPVEVTLTDATLMDNHTAGP